MKNKSKIAVMVMRESDGQIYSMVSRKEYPHFGGNSIVIDRVKGRQFDIKTVTHRAKALAKLLGVEYIEDFTWNCQAIKKLICRCPDCVKAGRC